MAHCEIGAFVGTPNHCAPAAEEIRAFEQLINRHLGTILFFWTWSDGDFPSEGLKSTRDHDGYDTEINLHLTWEPWQRSGVFDTSYSLSSIIKGQHDAYISRFARGCRDWKETIRLRFAHEMIHDNNPETPGWYPWQDQPEEYVRAWNHVHNIFNQERAENVEFVWSPLNYPAWFDALKNYYPGPDKVDWLAIDGYNWGAEATSGWPYDQNFADLFYPVYLEFVNHPEIFGNKRIMISELATPQDNPFGGNKFAWITDMLTKIRTEFTRIEAFYWFNAVKEKDWRIDSSPGGLESFRAGISDPYFTSHPVKKP